MNKKTILLLIVLLIGVVAIQISSAAIYNPVTLFNTITGSSTAPSMASYFVATSTTNNSLFQGNIGIGTSYLGGTQWAGGGILDAGSAPFQVTNEVNDLKNNIVISNMSQGAYAAGCLTFYNASSTTGLAGNAYGDICYSGPNFNSATAPGGGLVYGSVIPGLPANSLVQVATRGALLFGSLSSTSTEAGISWSVGPGYQTGNYDMVLNDLDPVQFPNDKYVANLGLGTTSPRARLAIVASSTSLIPYLQIASSTNGTASYAGTVAQQPVFNVNFSGNVGIGTSTETGMLTIKAKTTNGTTTIATGKLQFDGYNSAGTRTCAYVVGTTWVITSGACANP